MKKHLIRAVSSLIGLLLVLSSFAGCGETKNTGEKDFGGRVFKIGAWYDLAPKENRSEWDDAYLKRIRETEEKYNCKIEFVVINDTNKAYVTSTLGGDPVADVVVALSYDILPGYILGDIAYPLSDLKAFDFNEYKWNQAVIELGKYDGKVYAMDIKKADTRYGIFYNKTLFEQQGLPDLQELYQKGEWNWDKMLEVAKQVQWDQNGDNEVDVYPLAGDYLMWNLIYSNGATLVDRTDKAVKLNSLSDPKVVEALDFGARLQKEAKVLPYETDTLFQWGSCAMYVGEWWKSGAWCTKDGMRQMNDKYSFVPFPKGYSASDYISYGKEISPYFILKTVKNPEDVAFIFNEITNLADSDAQWDKWMEMEAEIQADDSDTVDNVVNMIREDKVRINPLAGFKDIYNTMNEMFDKIGNSELTTQVALEQYAKVLDNLVKDANDKDWSADYKNQYQGQADDGISETTTFQKLEQSALTVQAAYYSSGDSSFETVDAKEASDGDAATAYRLTRTQTANDMLVVKLPQGKKVGKIVLAAASAQEAPGEVKVQTSVDGGQTWSSDQATIKNQTDGAVTEIVFDSFVQCDAVMVQLKTTDTGKTWSIAEAEIYVKD